MTGAGSTFPASRPSRNWGTGTGLQPREQPLGEADQSRQLQLDRIAAQVAECDRCPLHLSRTQGVPGSGPATAQLMAVGEAPGEREDAAGRPFVGAAGKLLTELLEGIGLSRDDIFITNVLKSRPPANRDPLPEEVSACAPYLDAQMAVIDPKVVLVLGRHALERLLPGAPGISRCHGQIIKRNGRSYMPLFHPAAALYNGSMLPLLQEDFRSLRRELDSMNSPRALAVAQTPAPPESNEQLDLF